MSLAEELAAVAYLDPSGNWSTPLEGAWLFPERGEDSFYDLLVSRRSRALRLPEWHPTRFLYEQLPEFRA
jgi:hypothetical protein